MAKVNRRSPRPGTRLATSQAGTGRSPARAAAIAAGALAGALSGAAPLHAQTTDMSKVTCANYLTLPALDQAQLVIWLAGYYAGGAGRPAIDVAVSRAALPALTELCTKTPQIPLIGAETRAFFALPPNQ